MDEGAHSRNVPLAWIGVEELPLLYSDQFIVQYHEGTFIMSIGQSVPPAFIGTQEEREQQLEQITYVPVKPVARVAFTPAKLDALIDALHQTRDLARQQEWMEGGDGA